MPSPEMLALFLAAALALNLTPGPDMLYVTARSVAEGRLAGVLSALGIAVGCLFHLAAVALGLAALLTAVPMAYDALRIAGAIYLVVLGLGLLLRPGKAGVIAQHSRSRLIVVFAQGVVTNILNPKVALFFLAFLPQFVDLDAGPAVPQILVLGLLFNAQGTAVNLAVALMATRATRWLRSAGDRLSLVQRLAGALLIGLGARLAFAGAR